MPRDRDRHGFVADICQAGRGNVGEASRIDGIDIWPLMAGENIEEAPRKDFYYYRENVLQAVRQGEWKLNTYRKSWGIEKPEKTATCSTIWRRIRPKRAMLPTRIQT